MKRMQIVQNRRRIGRFIMQEYTCKMRTFFELFSPNVSLMRRVIEFRTAEDFKENFASLSYVHKDFFLIYNKLNHIN